MRAFVVSDIHRIPMDIYRGPLGVPEADICICAGDVTDNVYTTVDYVLAEIATKMPVVLVLGNHDYYSTSIDRAVEIARVRFAGTNVHFLEDDTVEVQGVRFVGATLWTNFESPHGTLNGEPELPIMTDVTSLSTSASGISPTSVIFIDLMNADPAKRGS